MEFASHLYYAALCWVFNHWVQGEDFFKRGWVWSWYPALLITRMASYCFILSLSGWLCLHSYRHSNNKLNGNVSLHNISLIRDFWSTKFFILLIQSSDLEILEQTWEMWGSNDKYSFDLVRISNWHIMKYVNISVLYCTVIHW